MGKWICYDSICINLHHVISFSLKHEGILFHVIVGDPVLVVFDSREQAEYEYEQLLFRITTVHHHKKSND